MIKTGILGTSDNARLYAEVLKHSDTFELTGCFSPDYTKSKYFASQFELVAYPSAEALFNYTDALIVTGFSPDFLINTEKAVKSFKHILITNPFLAGLEEIMHLRKLSEESGVLMQIAGGFRFANEFNKKENGSPFLADLKHIFRSGNNICQDAAFPEHLLGDVSLLLLLLRGIPKKTSVHSWETGSGESLVLSVRIELDNGNVANYTVSQTGDKEDILLNMNGALQGYAMGDHTVNTNRSVIPVREELKHFENSIISNTISNRHNDTMFQALELAHKIKAKTIQNFAVNYLP